MRAWGEYDQECSRCNVRTNRLAKNSAMIAGVEVSCFASLAMAEAEWLALEAQAACTYYQSLAWCKAWTETIGKTSAVKPFILIGKSKSNDAQFLLPFQIRKRYGLSILEWLCQPENNYGHGIFKHGLANMNWQDWFNENILHVLALLPHHDVAALCNMPETVFDRHSPLSALHRFASANQSFVTHLEPNFEALLQKKRAPRSISKIRRRDQRLAEAGALEIEILSSSTQSTAALSEMLLHKSLQLSEIGVDSFAIQNLIGFFDGLLQSKIGELHLFRLQQSGKTISALLGASYANTFWLLVLSMSPDAPLQFSPGDYILRKSIAWACENKLQTYDFSTGHSHYKEIWVDKDIQLYDYFAAKTLKGFPLAAVYVFFFTAKRIVKNTPAFKNFLFGARKFLRRKTRRISD